MTVHMQHRATTDGSRDVMLYDVQGVYAYGGKIITIITREGREQHYRAEAWSMSVGRA